MSTSMIRDVVEQGVRATQRVANARLDQLVQLVNTTVSQSGPTITKQDLSDMVDNLKKLIDADIKILLDGTKQKD